MTRVPVRTSLALVAGLLAACGGGSPVVDPSASDAPDDRVSAALAGRGQGDVVVLYEYSGGFVMAGFQFLALPTLAVYADGTVLAAGQGPDPLVVDQLEDDDLRALVTDLIEADIESYPDRVEPTGMIGIADAPDTTITVDLGDGPHSVTAYALGFETAPGQHPYPMGLVNIDRRLQELASDVASVGEAYAAERARVTAYADEFSEPGPAWPQDVVPVPDGAVAATLQSPATVDVDGADEVAALTGAFGEFRQATFTLDGANLTVVWRPLLPHE